MCLVTYTYQSLPLPPGTPQVRKVFKNERTEMLEIIKVSLFSVFSSKTTYFLKNLKSQSINQNVFERKESFFPWFVSVGSYVVYL